VIQLYLSALHDHNRRLPEWSQAFDVETPRQTDSLLVRTNLSALNFRYGDRGGSLTDFPPVWASSFRNSIVGSSGAKQEVSPNLLAELCQEAADQKARTLTHHFSDAA
jgi:hypothetical protein